MRRMDAEVVWTGWGKKGVKISRATTYLPLQQGGVYPDRHFGMTAHIGVREKYLAERGTKLALNPRQLTVVSAEENGRIAERLGVPDVLPEDLGANIMLRGIPLLTARAVGGTTIRFPETGHSIFVTMENTPCIHPGNAIKARLGLEELAMPFTKAAEHCRGICAVVYVVGPGRSLRPGDAAEVYLPN